MGQTVVLVRHGKAEPKRAGQPDEERKLTGRGNDALAAAFPDSFRMLKVPIDGIQLWVSPTVRAIQTAYQVRRVVDIDDEQQRRCLADQDIDAFFDELSKSEFSTIIAVGHIPFMNKVSGILCGCELPFAPGAVACIELQDSIDPTSLKAAAEAPGRLLWFIQGPKV
ncbi:MAG: histidine phosphatase family protein [Atopobiaceae bacterium]|jgi:phosphohistidine phosphatase|nr:histidine phosphatase family protein [Atopobiaceae bacterium]